MNKFDKVCLHQITKSAIIEAGIPLNMPAFVYYHTAVLMMIGNKWNIDNIYGSLALKFKTTEAKVIFLMYEATPIKSMPKRIIQEVADKIKLITIREEEM